jgi:cold-inducible RNA-binding protein
MGNRLYVGNLSFSTSQQAIEAAFAAAGEVVAVDMPTDIETGQPRGFAFVTMGSSQAANAAIAQLSGLMRDGREIKVNEAQERPPAVAVAVASVAVAVGAEVAAAVAEVHEQCARNLRSRPVRRWRRPPSRGLAIDRRSKASHSAVSSNDPTVMFAGSDF